MSNRVEDLEHQVAELQAAVNGLTEELVEMKERVRQLEDEREVPVEADASPAPDAGATRDPADESPDAHGDTQRTHSDDHVAVVERTDAGEANGATGDASGGAAGDADADRTDGSEDDAIVPEQSTTTPDAEAAKSAAEGDGDDGGESDDGDIIVA